MKQAVVSVKSTSGQSISLKDLRLTAFALSNAENATNIRVVGCFSFEHSPKDHFPALGKISIQGVTYPIIDRQKTGYFEPKKITDESCIVFFDSDKSLNEFDHGILVDNVGEMLSIAHEGKC